MKKRSYRTSRHGRLWEAMLVAFVLCFTGCKDENEQAGTSFDPDRPVTITDFTPKKAGYGNNLIVYGDNFGNDLSKVKVTIGGKTAKVIGIKNQSLYCVIPEKAYKGNIVISILDENGKVIASGEATERLEYEKKWLVSTFLGVKTETSSEFEEKEGWFDDCGSFEGLDWFSFDPRSDFDHLYISGGSGKRNRLVDFAKEGVDEEGNHKKGYVSFFKTEGINRVSCINWTAPTDKLHDEDMIISHNINQTNTRGHYIFSRASNFTQKTAIEIDARSTNSTIVHPKNGEFYYSLYWDKQVHRYDFASGIDSVAFITPNEKTSIFMVPHPTGKYAYLMIFERHYIARTDYDEETKCFGNPVLICGSNNSASYKDGVGTKAQLNHPTQGVFVYNEEYAGQEDEYDFYFCDRDNHAIRILTPQGRVSTFAGRGNNGESGYADGELRTEARFNQPNAIAYDGKRKCFYVGDVGNNVIRKIAKEGDETEEGSSVEDEKDEGEGSEGGNGEKEGEASDK